MRPTAIDICCGAGGASMGLRQAGFNPVGLDYRPQPRYPFSQVTTDVTNADFQDLLQALIKTTNAQLIFASPPCQQDSNTHTLRNRETNPAGPRWYKSEA